MISLRCCYNNLQQFNDMQDSLEKQTEKSKTYWSIPFIYNSSVKAGVNPKPIGNEQIREIINDKVFYELICKKYK